jgi:NAD+--dinitrogen-reductase ADP-D-ribosyltransferase
MKKDSGRRTKADGRAAGDAKPTICSAGDIPATLARLTAPPSARRPVNRCNLPAEALASLAFQLAPVALELDGVLPLHRPLFDRLAGLDDAAERAECFQAYMRAHFLLDDAPSGGLSARARIDRSRLDYLRLLRGWLFDAESREGAVLKGWVESRFGLLTRFHREPVVEADGPARAAFERELAAGLYATGALEAQLDLLYAFAQSELVRRHPGATHLTLYRGVSGRCAIEPLGTLPDGRPLVLLNNLSSFSASRERADEFGDRVIACELPLAKLLAFSHLLPERLQGEDEYLVIGGVVAARAAA